MRVYLGNELKVRAYDVLILGTEKEALFSPVEILEHAIILKSKLQKIPKKQISISK